MGVKLSFSPDSKSLLFMSSDGVSLVSLPSCSFDDAVQYKLPDTASAETLVNSDAQLSPDGKFVVIPVRSGGKVWLFDSATGKALRELSFADNTQYESTVSFLPGGKYALLEESASATAAIYDSNWQLLATLHTNYGLTMAQFTPGGQYVAYIPQSKDTAPDNGLQLAFVDPATGKVVKHFSITGTNFTFAADGKTVVIYGYGDKTSVLDAANGGTIRQFDSLQIGYGSVALSPDGRFIVAQPLDSTYFVLWDTNIGREVRRLAPFDNMYNIDSLQFSPDGRFIIFRGNYLGEPTVLNLPIDYHERIDFACSRVTRDLTANERTVYGIADNEPTCPQFAKVANGTN